LIGKTISQYKILEKLGEGGMGVVYKALDLKLERYVAVKFLPPEITVGSEDKARFLQEARAASAISHANVCVIYDIAEHDGLQFIVMEYVDGKTLRQLVPIEKVQDALGYAIQIGEALEEAHCKGIVHRDIKTDNIMVNDKKQVKVMDFGLAKLRGSLKLTRTSSTVGTLAYMAPEQIQGGEVDARSDIFSFGVVLYEMLTGHLPFVGEHEAAVMYSILNDSPLPIQKFKPDLSSELLHIVNRALEKDPEERYQTVREMVIDLRRAKKETSRVSRPAAALKGLEPGIQIATDGQTQRRDETAAWTPPGQSAPTQEGWGTPLPPGAGGRTKRPGQERRLPGRAFLWVGLAGVLVALAAILAFVVLPGRAPRLNPNMSFRTIDVPFAELGYCGLSRDGKWFAFSARDAKKEWSIYFMNVAGGTPRRLVPESFGSYDYAEVSPDGSQVLFAGVRFGRPRGIYVVSSLGGTSRKIVEPGCGARWRPDGQLIGYVKDGGVRAPSQSGRREFWTVRPDGSQNRLEFVDSLSYVFAPFCFDWSPDGNSVAWLRSYPDYGEMFIRHLKSGRERQLTLDKRGIDEIAWAPNNQIFFTSSKSGNSNIWMIPAKGGEAVQVTKGTGPDYGVRVSADGKRLLYVERRTIHHLWTADADGRNARQLTFENQALSSPCFSPDNKRISFHVYSSDPLRSGSQVFVMDSDGTNRTQLTSGDAEYFGPSWSPDGKYMAYITHQPAEPYDSARVWVVDASNPGTPRLAVIGLDVLWISNEQFVTWTSLPNSHSVLYSINSNEPLEVSQDSTWQVSLHYGKHVLLGDTREGRTGWYLKATGTGQETVQTQIVPSEYYGSSYPSVSLRYLLSRQANGELWRISLPDGKRERLPELFDGINPLSYDIRFSYDDRKVVYLKGQSDSRVILIENLFK
jgi:Tol biopolymer transport system component/predicted Ser/Thr protein kinase